MVNLTETVTTTLMAEDAPAAMDNLVEILGEFDLNAR